MEQNNRYQSTVKIKIMWNDVYSHVLLHVASKSSVPALFEYGWKGFH